MHYLSLKMWWPLSLVALNAVVILATKQQRTKSVTTLIDAQWEATPVVLEVAEFLADENPDYLWSFVDSVSHLEPPLVETSPDKARYERVLAAVSGVLTSTQLSVLKLALSLHIYSPKVEMYAQMARERGVLCPVAVDLAGRLTCDLTELKSLLTQTPTSQPRAGVKLYELDHHYPGSENASTVAVLYGELGTPELAMFHELLKIHAAAGTVDYVLRHHVKERPQRKVRLSGYGVELQIKSTEYKAQDDTQVKGEESSDSSDQDDDEQEVQGFNFNRLGSLYPDLKEDLEVFRQHLLDSSSDMAPLKVWQVQELSLQAAERIMSAPREEALKLMTTIAQNFPLQAKSLVRTPVSEALKKEVKLNQDMFSSSLNLQPTDTALFINGMFFDLDVVDMISLLDVVRQELRVLEGLYKIGISESRMSSILALDLSGGSSSNQEYAIDIRDSAVMWVNDIEHDKQYRRWSDSLMELLRPTFPGMLRSIRRNLYHLVIIADPAKLEARPLLKLAESFYVHTAPLRLGLVFAVNPDETVSGLEDPGVAMLNAFNYASEQKDAYSGLAFITDVYAAVKEDRDITVEDVRTQLKSKYPQGNVEEILGEDSEYNTGRKLAKDFLERSGFRRHPQVLLNGVPLSDKSLTSDEFEEAVLTEIMSQTPTFQKAVYKGEFSDSDDSLDFIMNQANVMPRLNDRVLNQDNQHYLDMSGALPTNTKTDNFPSLSTRDKTAMLVGHMRYFSTRRQHGDNGHPVILTHWIVGDMDSSEGRHLLHHALEQMLSSGSVRVGLLVNPLHNSGSRLLNQLVLAALETLPPIQASHYISTILASDTLSQAISSGEKDPRDVIVQGVDLSNLTLVWQQFKSDFTTLNTHQTYSRTVLNLSPGARAVVTNGRVLGPLDAGERFTTDDFSLLERFNMNNYGDKLLAVLKKQGDDDDVVTSDILMQTVALLVSRTQSRSRFEIPFKGEEYSVVNLPPRNPSEPILDLVAVVDPVSRGAQKVGPILSVLQEVLNCNIRLFLNCVEKHSDMPLKSFYRFVVEPELQFVGEGHHSPGPVARFTNMPESTLFTQNMHVPENWLVESVRSLYDLDNIRLEDVDSGVHSEFELEYLLLEGHCFEASMGNPPRGLQITLGTELEPVKVDTIVMANLGYFQLKANPGAWTLRLRQGRSAEIFDIVSQEGTDTPTNSSDIKVLVSSFKSHVLKLKVSKKPDKMHMDLLSEDDSAAAAGLWGSITSTFGGSSKEEDDKEQKINIFSVASGHLYERFLRIMMLSVLKHTNTPVKFWFLKNYLSPTLKDYLPHMAQEYGFEYELVQYKWPRWLHQQREKQRIIWGYKILFLDVLFPLDVKKIIFVDADQVVRADMKELVDLDLGGAPYGYTPFCESRTEMEGFRFWKTGYWRNHLQGRRYHISALYVVDLRRFRRIAAGDRLRGQYQALSQDPNSLSNLDQDLPNNMIHQVAIKSLPQEWLWCETWCDNDSKRLAKTIDLCNNPLTKEAKLTAAMRIVEEWKDYDAELKRIQKKMDDSQAEDIGEVHQHTHTIDSHSEL